MMGGASTTAFTVSGATYLNVLNATGNTTLANATTTNLFSTTASSTNLFAQTATLGSLSLGTALPVASGGTGQKSFGQGWLSSDGTTISASTSPTVNYIIATSTTATSTFAFGLQATKLNITDSNASSTFANGINLTKGCFAVNGNCLTIGSFGGTLSIANGGTNATSFTTGQPLAYDGTRFVSTSTLSAVYGGTGVNNGASTITLGGNLTTSGANPLTLTTTGLTNVTLPTSGTLVNTGVTSLSSLATVGTITSGTWSGSFGAVSGANLTSLTAANISAGTAGINISGTAAVASSVNFNGGLTTGSSPTFSTLYSQVYYDSNDTSFYVDPNGASNMNYMYLSYMYDRENTGYYLDMNNTTHLNALSADGTISGSQFNGSGAGLTGTAASLTAGSANAVSFNGGQTLGGTGTVVFGNSNSANSLLENTAGAALTIGSGITVKGQRGYLGYDPNLGGSSNAVVVNNGAWAV